MRLIDNVDRVLKHAWSVRLIAMAGLLSGLEVALPYFTPQTHTRVFAALSGLVCAAAFVARLVAQKKVAPNADE